MKSNFSVKEISRDETKDILYKYHYTGLIYESDIVEEYRYHGLFEEDNLIGAAQYSSYCEPKCNRRWLREYYGCEPLNGYRNFFELSRLAVADCEEYNITSWFLSRSMKMLKADYICTSSDPRIHNGVIYAATNWTHHGLHKGRVEWNDNINDDHTVWSKVYNKKIEQFWENKPIKFTF